MVSDKGVLEILNTHLRDAIINHHCSTQHAFEVRVQFWAIGVQFWAIGFNKITND
jgi:hypothetical protein